MAIKLGTTTASLYLGSTPVAAYLGAAQVYSAATVPGAPTTEDEEWNGSFTVVFVAPPASDGGSAITGYRFYFDNVLVEPDADVDNVFFEFSGNYSGQTVEVSAVNAVGEGPRSAGVVVVDGG